MMLGLEEAPDKMPATPSFRRISSMSLELAWKNTFYNTKSLFLTNPALNFDQQNPNINDSKITSGNPPQPPSLIIRMANQSGRKNGVGRTNLRQEGWYILATNKQKGRAMQLWELCYHALLPPTLRGCCSSGLSSSHASSRFPRRDSAREVHLNIKQQQNGNYLFETYFQCFALSWRENLKRTFQQWW